MEHVNPAGSHNARTARHIIRKAIADGELKPGERRRIIEKSGGNFGVGLAFKAAKHDIGAGSIGTLSGYSLLEVGVLAGLLYAGLAQFLFYGMAAAGAAPIAIVFAVLLVNIRYLLMGSALSPYFRGQNIAWKFIGGALLTDETFGVAAQHAKEHGNLPFFWLLGLNVTAYINWLIANLVGVALARPWPAAPGLPLRAEPH